MFRNLIAVIVFTLLISSSYAQEKWSLEKCITQAQQNSLSVKQAQFDVSRANLNLKQSQLSRLPSLNGTISGGYSFGLSLNPTTNTLQNLSNGINNLSLSSGMLIYGGNRINNSIKQSKIDIEAAKLNIEAAANDVGLNVASAYLNILLAEEQLENAKKSLSLSESQLEQTDKLIEAGSLPYNDRLDIIAQMALDQQRIIEAENLVISNYLTLKQLMLVEPSQEVVIEKPVIPELEYTNPENFVLEKTFNSALSNLPDIQANEMQLRSFEIGEDIAKANLLPRLTLFGNLDSRFSNSVKDFANSDFSEAQEVLGQARPFDLDGQRVNLSPVELDGIIVPDRKYFDQLNDNFGQSISVSLNIPIFNNYQNRITVEQARVNTLNQQVINQQQRQTLKSNIQVAIANAKASQENLEAAETSLEAAQAAFTNANKRYDLGAINTLEFTTARNRLDQAQVELTRAKYQYVFNLKVVEFYEGKPLRLE